MPRHDANTRLTALLRQADWSGQDLANAVNAAGAENGLALRYDRTSVAHWLSGSRPSPIVAALVAEVLSRRLGRPVRLGETGFTAPPESHTTDDVLAPLLRPGDTRHARRPVVYTTNTESLRDMAELAATTSPPAARGQERVGTAHVKAATLMLSVFSDMDFALGSGRRPPSERRARAITTARLAELHLRTGRLDHACAAWATSSTTAFT